MKVLIRTDEAGNATGVHYSPERLSNPNGLLVDSLVKPDRLVGRDYKLEVVDKTPMWKSRTSAEEDKDGNVVTPAGPWEDETETLAAQMSVMRSAAQRQFDAHYENILQDLKKSYPEPEREGWREQIDDALAYQDRLAAGGDSSLVDTSDLDVLTRLVTEGESTEEVAGRILSMRQQYRKNYGDATGWLRRVRSSLSATATGVDIENLLAAEGLA